MGALYGGTCFDSAASAARAYFSGVSPAVLPGSVTYVSTVEEGPTDAWAMVTREGSTVIEVNPLSYPAFVSCDPMQTMFDGMSLGWLVAGVWVAAWAVTSLKRAFV